MRHPLVRRHARGAARFLFCFLWFGFGALVPAQENPKAPYLIPRTVYVGDRCRMVCPLDPPAEDMSAFSGTSRVLDQPDELPPASELGVSRLDLDGRTGVLLIDFTAYAPGLLELPPLEIGGRRFTGLRVNIGSVLDSGTALSPSAPPLAVPGTFLIIYGTVFGLAAALLLGILGIFWSRYHFGDLRLRFRRRRLVRAMERFLRRLRSSLARGRIDAAETLGRLSSEFRIFLGLFAGMNCRAMTPREFLSYPVFPGNGRFSGNGEAGPVLRDLFRRCDLLRFSGEEIARAEAVDLVNEAGTLVEGLAAAVFPEGTPENGRASSGTGAAP
jgi:hypothetical protein